MIDCARVLFSVGSARASSPRHHAEEVVYQLDPDECQRRAGIGAQLQHCLSEEHRA